MDVSLKSVCSFCNTSVSALCNDHKCCMLHMLGMCKKTDCNWVHAPASDKEAAHILALLEKAVQNPEDLKAAQGK
eukprot:9060193-Ditylum_brightwellii.AAC.1